MNGTQVISYTYDELNQLVRENNAVLNKTITYTYVLGGNMTSRKEYAYTTGTLGTPTKTDTFTYGNTDWKDQLTAYNGVGITYDSSGNPLSYRGMTLSWQKGRQLASVIKDGTTTSFTYDSRGHRIRKTSGTGTGGAVNQTITRYFYNGDTLIGLVKGNQTVQFVYDTEGRPFLMRVYTANNATPADYYYLYNGQGDVTGLIDSSNHDVVHYSYDSWGKMVSVTDTTSASISTLNPFRYRGYIYDPETELYYLGSRYYDAEEGRFINPDDHNSLNVEQNNLNQFNLYAYCCNNPIDRYDADGEWSLPNWAKVAIGAVSTVAAVAVTVATGGAALPVLAGVAISTVVSGVIGYKKNGTRGLKDGLADGFMIGGLSALGGSIISAGIKAVKTARQGITIGRNMAKVDRAAGLTESLTYSEEAIWKPLKKNIYNGIKRIAGEKAADMVSYACNKFYIKTMRSLGAVIYDSGLNGAKEVGLYYGMELKVLKGYANLVRMY